MSFFPGQDPQAGDAYSCDAIAHVVVPRTVDLGDGFAVRRALPSARSRMVGPFVFFDHFGPAEFRAGTGLDVRPHPHIGLSTVTYLFDGEIVHRDSLGTALAIRPGEINWMTAGRGIVHSERTDGALRTSGSPIHGLQMWVALPAASEEIAPGFAHHDTGEFPVIEDGGKTVRVVVGSLYGAASPVPVLHETMFGDFVLKAGTSVPIDASHEERAIYILDGIIDIAGDKFEPGRLLVFKPGDRLTVTAATDAHFVLCGGAPMDGPRHIWWNFVSSRKDRIEQAKADWKAGHFDKVLGDEIEFIPLPEK
ncbi:pirin [Pseudolabrys sp. Root1462]|uniref:pirin family protein n=1 Tax=Pseudolabrys sp. Root1462 TaxID=1736466 RepID=UPI0007031C8A|nr:pirin family protein [Pseudolabrys sp. Root1462]KQZ01253.1 pirin [Pseudolabrys sp. Root1462]